MAITWQNVSGPSVAQAASSLGDAQKTFSGMFSGIDDILKKREAMETANWDQGKLNNAETLKAMLYGAKTPEAMAALQASGEYDRARAAMGAQVDKPSELNALADGRMATLQQRGMATQQYTDQQTEVANRPVAAGYQGALAQATTPEGVRGLMDSMQAAVGAGAMDPRIFAKIMQEARSTNTALVGEERAASEFVEKGKEWEQKAKMRPFEEKEANARLAAQAAARNLSNAQATQIPLAAARAEQEANIRNFERLTALSTANGEKVLAGENAFMGGKGALTGINAALATTIKDPKSLTRLTSQLSEVLKDNPQFNALPTSVVQQIAASYGTSVGGYLMNNYSSEMKADLNKALLDYAPLLETKQSKKSNAQLLQGELNLATASARDVAFPAVAKQLEAAYSKQVEKDKAEASASLAEVEAAKKVETKPLALNVPTQATTVDPVLEEQAQLEKDEISAGQRKQLTKETAEYLKTQPTQADQSRQQIEAMASGTVGNYLSFRDSIGNATAAAGDIATLPFRGVGRVVNRGISLPNAYGAGFPTIPEEAAGLNSLTPFADNRRKTREQAIDLVDLKARRAAFDKRIEEAKKAK